MGAENNGWALLLTEYVIHIAMYHKEKANVYEWKGNAIYHTLNDEVCQVRFTDEKMAAVRYSRERGRLIWTTGNTAAWTAASTDI